MVVLEELVVQLTDGNGWARRLLIVGMRALGPDWTSGVFGARQILGQLRGPERKMPATYSEGHHYLDVALGSAPLVFLGSKL